MKRRLAFTVLLVLGISAVVSSNEKASAFNHKTQSENEPCAIEIERAQQQNQSIEKSELLESSPVYQLVSFI